MLVVPNSQCGIGIAPQAHHGGHSIAGVETQLAQEVFFGVVLRTRLQALGSADVTMGHDDSRDNGPSRDIDALRSVWNGSRLAGPHGIDPAVTHDEDAVFDRVAACTVDDRRTYERLDVRALVRLVRGRGRTLAADYPSDEQSDEGGPAIYVMEHDSSSETRKTLQPKQGGENAKRPQRARRRDLLLRDPPTGRLAPRELAFPWRYSVSRYVPLRARRRGALGSHPPSA